MHDRFTHIRTWAAACAFVTLTTACTSDTNPGLAGSGPDGQQTLAPQAQSSAADSVAAAYQMKTTFKPFVSAHRGGAAYAPENTLIAYRNAARLGVDDFETDATLTKDGKLVLVHDATLDRTSDCTGAVIDKTFDELQQCDAGFYWTFGQATTRPTSDGPFPYRGKGIRFPLAETLFAYAKSLGPFGPTVTIEIKNIPGEAGFEPRCPRAAAELVRLIAASGIRERIIVQSFDASCLLTVRRLDSAVQTLYLSFGTLSDNAAVARVSGFNFSSPSFSAPDFSAQSVSLVQSQGIKVNPYTIDQPAALERAIGFGVDGIISNYPACLLQLQKRPLPQRMLSPEIAATERAAAVCP